MIETIWRLRHRLNRFRRLVIYRIEDEVWSLRLRLVFHLVGNKSFAANIHVVGALHLEKTTFCGPMIRNICIFDTEERRKNFMEKKQ